SRCGGRIRYVSSAREDGVAPETLNLREPRPAARRTRGVGEDMAPTPGRTGLTCSASPADGDVECLEKVAPPVEPGRSRGVGLHIRSAGSVGLKPHAGIVDAIGITVIAAIAPPRVVDLVGLGIGDRL